MKESFLCLARSLRHRLTVTIDVECGLSRALNFKVFRSCRFIIFVEHESEVYKSFKV